MRELFKLFIILLIVFAAIIYTINEIYIVKPIPKLSSVVIKLTDLGVLDVRKTAILAAAQSGKGFTAEQRVERAQRYEKYIITGQ